LKTAAFPSFQRGITDFPIDVQNYGRKLDNVLLDSAGKPFARPGSVTWFTANQQIPGATRIAGFFRLWTAPAVYRLLVFSQNKVYAHGHNMNSSGLNPGSATWVEVKDTLGNSFNSSGSANTRFSPWLWAGNHVLVFQDLDISISAFGLGQNQRAMVIYPKAGNTPVVRGAGLPTYGADWGAPYVPTVAAGNVVGSTAGGAAPTVADGVKSSGSTYVYQFYWTYSYVDGAGTTHLVIGPPVTAVINTSSASPNPPNVKFKNLPWFPTNADDHLDPSLFTLNIARQGVTDGIYHGVAKFTYAQWNALAAGKVVDDNFEDALLPYQTQYSPFTPFISVYNGSVALPSDPPKGVQYGGVVNDTGYALVGSTLYQAWPGTIDVWPASFFVSFEEPARGFAEMDYPIVFLQSKVYRVEGVIDSAGNGNMTKRLIVGDKGAVSSQAIVRVGRQIFWAANDGFYVTDGFSARKISGHLDTSYARLTADFTGALAIKGEFIPQENRIYWSMRDPASASGDNELVWVLDLSQGLDPGGSFTTWSSSGLVSGTWSATAFIAGPGKSLLRGDKAGFVWVHKDGQIDDVSITGPGSRIARSCRWCRLRSSRRVAKRRPSGRTRCSLRCGRGGTGRNASQRHQIGRDRDGSGILSLGLLRGSRISRSRLGRMSLQVQELSAAGRVPV
jgi:hypothetical protein